MVYPGQGRRDIYQGIHREAYPALYTREGIPCPEVNSPQAVTDPEVNSPQAVTDLEVNSSPARY